MAHTGKRHEQRRHRPHRPHELGPRLLVRGRWYGCDLRPWGGGKPTLRNPRHPGWPREGERLEAIPQNEALARRWSWAYVEAARDGLRAALDGRRPTPELGSAIAAFLAHRERTVAPGTVDSNRSILSVLEDAFGPRERLGRIGTAELQRLLDARLAAGYSPRTLRTARAVWGAFFRWAGLEPVPTSGLVLPQLPDEELHAFTDAELERLRAAADAVDASRRVPLARRFLELGLATGGRIGELRALRWSDFDPDRRTVRIARQRAPRGSAERPTKSRRGRTALVLEPWWAERYDADARGYVLERDGRPVSDSALRDLFERISDTAGVPGTPHDLRRTYGRLFLRAGGTLDELKVALGHRSIRTTERQYAAIRDAEVMQGARARMAGGPRLWRSGS